MARPQKKGLDYFPFDVDFFDDDKIAAVAIQYGIKGEISAVKLLCAIYREGYFIVWRDSVRIKLLRQLPGVREELLEQIVQCLVKYGFFDKGLFHSAQVLTSRGIQKRYFSGVKRNKRTVGGSLPYLLVESPEMIPPKCEKKFSHVETKTFSAVETEFSHVETPFPHVESTQSKVNSIVKENKFSSPIQYPSSATSPAPAREDSRKSPPGKAAPPKSPKMPQNAPKCPESPPSIQSPQSIQIPQSPQSIQSPQSPQSPQSIQIAPPPGSPYAAGQPPRPSGVPPVVRHPGDPSPPPVAVSAETAVPQIIASADTMQQLRSVLRLPDSEIRAWLDRFLADCRLRDKLLHRDTGDVMRHFLDWLRIQQRTSRRERRQQAGDSPQERFDAMRKELIYSVTAEEAEASFAQTALGAYDPQSGTLTIDVPTREVFQAIETRHLALLSKAMHKHFPGTAVQYRIMP